MKITPRFYKRNMPAFIDGNIHVIDLRSVPGTARMFIRHDDSDNYKPARVAVEMTRSEIIRLIAQLEYVKERMA